MRSREWQERWRARDCRKGIESADFMGVVYSLDWLCGSSAIHHSVVYAEALPVFHHSVSMFAEALPFIIECLCGGSAVHHSVSMWKLCDSVACNGSSAVHHSVSMRELSRSSFSAYAEGSVVPWSMRSSVVQWSVVHSVSMRELCIHHSVVCHSGYLCGSSVARWSARELCYSSFSIYAEALSLRGLRGSSVVHHSVVYAEALPFSGPCEALRFIIQWSVQELCYLSFSAYAGALLFSSLSVYSSAYAGALLFSSLSFIQCLCGSSVVGVVCRSFSAYAGVCRR